MGMIEELLKDKYKLRIPPTVYYDLLADVVEAEKKQEPTTKNDDLALIHTWGLDEEIRCIMCTNSMKSDKGCDGSCVVNKDMYKAVGDAIEKRIQSTIMNDLGVDCISRADALNCIKATELKKFDWIIDAREKIRNLPSVTLQEPAEKICSKTCGTCRYFRKHRNKRNIEICKELYGENTICGHCTYWEDSYEVALPTTEYDYCSHHREVEE